jgi:hypothetical protein
VALELDGYVQEFKIVTRSSNTQLLLDNSMGEVPLVVGSGFVIRGKPKNEQFKLIGYSVHWQHLGKTQNAYQASSSGEVGA